MKIIRLFMIWITVAGFAASLHAQTTQQVTAIQYYYNTDPGVGNAGNGAIFSVTPAANIDQVFPFNVPATLANGFHYLYVRAQDELGRWSLTERRLFVIQSITATENITDYAYYFDTDPGVGNAGNGAIVPVTSTPNFSATVAITVPPSLTEGFHYLYVRTRDLSGQWSLIERRLFVIQSITATENITDYAYYFDTDPGAGNPGNGAIVPVSPTANFSATVAITVPATLTNGFHYLYIRTRDVSGQWSLSERRLFVTQAITPAEDITALEWYIDTDPGVGNGNPYPVVPATGEVNATLDLGGVPCLSPGTHYLYVRAKNTAGRWSIIERLSLALVAPEINVLGNAITIVDGDATPVAADGTDFGQPLPSVPVLHTFTIVNNGTSPLTISSLSMSGAEASSFTIAGISTPLTLAAAGSTTFTVSFAAAPVGNYNAMLNINSNDCDEAIYNFSLHGEVSCQPAAFSVCPANISVNNTANQCNAAVTYTATVTGDPAPVVTYTFTGATTGSGSGTGSGSTFNKGTTTVTINATNACGNVNCSFTVTVNDNQPPTIVCAAPVTINTTQGLCTGTTTLTPPTVSDNCTVTGNALNFDGVNDRLVVPHNSSLNFTTTATWEGWFKFHDLSAAQGMFNMSNPSFNSNGYYINMQGSGGWIIYSQSHGGPIYQKQTSTNTLTLNQWQHIAVVKNGADVRIYLNGVELVTTLGPAGSIPASMIPSTGNLYMGVTRGLNEALIQFFNGERDEVRIWNTARTQAQIQANMNNELNAQAGLVAAYHFNQGVAAGNNAGITTAIDASGNGNNATLNNFALTGPTSNWVGGNVSSAPAVTNNAPATYPIGNTTVTWTATDANNNIATCTQVVTVVDNQAPTIVCAAPVTINTTPGLCTGTTTLTSPTVSDNCTGIGNALNFDGVNDYVNIPHSPSLAIGNGPLTYECWITVPNVNQLGHFVTKRQPVSPFAQISLLFTDGANVFSPQPGKKLEFLLISTTGTGSYRAIVTTNNIINGGTFHVAAVSDPVSQTLKLFIDGVLQPVINYSAGAFPSVVNTEPLTVGYPNINLPSYYLNGTVDELRVWNTARTQAQIQANMNNELNAQAGLVAAYHFNQGVAAGNNAGITTAIDASGNSNNGTLNNFTLSGTTSNWVGGNVSSAPTVSNNAPATYPIGNTTVTWTATDANNNTATCTQVVTVIAPEINVKGNALTIIDGDNSPSATDDTDFGQPLPSVPVIHTFTIENNGTAPLTISSLSMSGANPSSFTIGGITTPLTLAVSGSTTFTVSFAAAPVGNYNAMLNINSNDCDEAIYNFSLHGEVSCQPAAFSVCPANISVNTIANQCNAAVTYTATVTGVPAPVVSYTFTGATTGSGSGTGSGSTFNKGITTVSINATNACGNVNCSFTVTVVDNQPPATPTLANVTVGECGGTPSAPTTTDNCAGTITGTTSTVFPITAQGTTVVTWTFNDGNGNSTTANQNVIVANTTAPTPDAATLANATGQCSATITTAPTATGNCGNTITGTTSDLLTRITQGTSTVTWTFTDPNGNTTATQTQSIVVANTTAPTPVAATLANATGQCSATITTAPTATGNCGNTITGTTSDLLTRTTQGTSTVTWTFTDPNGNTTATQTQNIVVANTTAPTPVAATLANATGQCSATITTAPTATGNCGNTITGTTSDVLTRTTQGTSTVTWTFTDPNGNTTATQTQNIVVADITPPTINCPPNIVLSACQPTATWNLPTANDNCTGFTVVQTAGPAPGASFANATTTTITYMVTDAGNNQTSCSFTVTRDAILTGSFTSTAILCYSDSSTIQLTGSGGTAPYTFTNPAGVITITNPTGVYTNGNGLFRQAAGTIVYTVTDAKNCTVGVSVTIGQPTAILVASTPTNASCFNGSNGSINLSASGGTPGNPVAYTYSWTGPNSFAATTQNISGLVAGIYRYTVTDGNNCSISSDIIIGKPTEIIVSETHTAVACLVGGVSTVTISATGGTPPYSSGIGNFSQLPGSHTYTVTDANGCTGSYTLSIVAGDYTAPTFTRPADIVIPFATGAVCYNATLTVTGDVVNELDDVTPSGPGLQATYTDMVSQCGFKTIIKRTWHLQDGCGNEAADQVQTITVTDNNTPYLIFAKKEAKFGKNTIINGSVGVSSSTGKAEFDKDSELLAPEFVRAANITVQSGSTVTNRIYTAANDGPQPAFYKYSGSTNSLGNLKISNTTATPVSGNYKKLTIKKDVTVTITGTLYGKIEIEPGATVTFSPVGGILNIGTLKVRGKQNDVTKIRFGVCISVRVDKKVDISENVWLNEEGQRVTFYLGDDHIDEGKFYVHGGNTRITANIYIKDGRLKVNGGGRDRSDGDRDCDDEERDQNEYNSGPTIMTGWFIVEKLESDGKYVTWNRNLCDTSSFGTGGGIITKEPARRSPVKDEYFEVKVLPNPSTNNFRLLVLSYGLEPVTVRVYNVSGVLITKLDKIPRGNIITVGSEYRGGTYFAEVIQGNKRKVVKLIKTN